MFNDHITREDVANEPLEVEKVCDWVESFGLWGSEIPDMLGLVER